MYRIVALSGKEIGVTDKINYIRKSENGSYISADNMTATGVAFQGVAYDLLGHNEIGGKDIVTISEVDSNIYIKASRQSAADIDYLVMMSEIELPRKEIKNNRPRIDELEEVVE